jgi:hypothetical protein
MTSNQTPRPCKLIYGDNIAPRSAGDARKLIGTRVLYLRERDIDKSGRGYISPQYGTIVDVQGRNVAIDHVNNFDIYLTELREMVELRKFSCALGSVQQWKTFSTYAQGNGLVLLSQKFDRSPGTAASSLDEATSVEFQTGASLSDLHEILRKLEGTETMLQTLRPCPLSENSLEPVPADEASVASTTTPAP